MHYTMHKLSGEIICTELQGLEHAVHSKVEMPVSKFPGIGQGPVMKQAFLVMCKV